MHLYTIVFVAIICLKIAQVHCNGLDNSLKIAVGSCNRHKQEGIWDIVSHHKPEKLILLGDNIYADKRKGFTIGFGMFEEANPFELSLEYARLGADQSFQDMIQEIGGLSNVYAIYDDHDFGIDNGGAHYQFKQESRDEFNKFFQVDYSQSHRETLEDGVYSSHIIETNINGVVLRIKVIMLDVRYNRVLEPSASCDFLGDKQWEWLERELDSSIYNPNAAPSRSNSSVCDAIDMRDGVCSEDHEGELEGGHVEPPVDLILLGSGIQILPQGKMIEETWDKLCVPNRERLLGMLSDTIEKSVKYNGHNDWNNHINIVLLSGDVHAAEISQARCHISQDMPAYPLIEYTSSGLTHSFTHHTPLKNISSAGAGDSPRVRSLSTPVVSKGWFAEWIYGLYQAVTPTHHRLHKIHDHYSQPHFSMLYIKPEVDRQKADINTRGHHYQQVHIDFHVINASNEVVMTHAIDYQTQGMAASHTISTGNNTNKCVLIHGDVPLYKILWTRFATAMWIMVCFLFPFLAIVWLICASLYYVFVGSELKRRHNMLVRNRKLMKKD